MYGLSLEWERCPDGVEMIDRGPPKRGRTLLSGEPGGVVVCYRTDRRVPVRYDISDLEDPIVLRFINVRDDDALIEFLSRFGLLNRSFMKDMPREAEWSNVQEKLVSIRNLVTKINNASRVQMIGYINKNFARPGGFVLTPELDLSGPGGATRLALHPQSLFGFMLMESAMIAAHGAQSTACQHCGEIFITGPLTGRRSHAMFCSDRCRVAAMRKRKAGKVKS